MKFEGPLADDSGGSPGIRRIHRVFSFPMAWSMRPRQTSRPNTSSVPNSGGAVLRPHTATRTGSNIWPALTPRSRGRGAQGRFQPVVRKLRRGERFARLFEHPQRHRRVAFLGDEFGGIVGRELCREEEIGHREHVVQQA